MRLIACLRSAAQATIYDNEHFGSYVAVVEQFVNVATEHSSGGVRGTAALVFPPPRLRMRRCSPRAPLPRCARAPAQDLLACCWLASAGTTQTHGDALLAVGGADNTVSLISMAASAVTAQLKGHTQARRCVASAARRRWIHR